jgi:hypothetical protein
MESSRNSVATYNVHAHLATIPGLHGQVLESVRISGNSYWYLRNEKNGGKKNQKKNHQEDAGMAPNIHGHLFINIHLLLNILGLHGQVFESATIISGNSYCYYRSEINERKINIGQEDARRVKVPR